MKVSACIELVWKLAAQEAVAGEFGEIEPDHFFAGLLKFSELPVENPEVAVAQDALPAKQLAADVTALRDVLGDSASETTRLRREFRERLGKGGVPYSGGQIHRSAASRTLFDEAARLADAAGSEVLSPAHLLAALLTSPTPAMTNLLGANPSAKGGKSSKTPRLNEFGKDLTRMAANGELPGSLGREAECKILLAALASKRRKSILLVSDNDGHVRDVVCDAARAIGSQQPVATLKGRRIVDVTSLKSASATTEEMLANLEAGWKEASSAKNIVLFGPAIGFANNNHGIDEWGELLKASLRQNDVQCICRVPRSVYQTVVDRDPDWRNHVEVMFIHAEAKTEIPTEL